MHAAYTIFLYTVYKRRRGSIKKIYTIVLRFRSKFSYGIYYFKIQITLGTRVILRPRLSYDVIDTKKY